MAAREDWARARLAALADYAICDTEPESQFDDIVFIASQICQTPVALVSLVETERQWFKAAIGVDMRETPIDQSVCSLGLLSTDLLIIPDLSIDDRTCFNPLVAAGPTIRFYAGAPLVTPAGIVIGMLCVIDTAPRPEGLSADQQRMLRALAGQVIALLELRKGLIVTQAGAARSVLAEEAGNVGTFEVDVPTDIALVSPELCRMYGLPVRASYPATTIEALIATDEAAIHSRIETRVDGSAEPIVEYRIHRPSDGAFRWISRRAEFVRDAAGRVITMIGVVQDVTEQRMLNDEISHRLKNTLALVQSIAMQTLRQVPDRAPIEEFERRLMALSAAHDVLLQRSQPTAPVRKVVDAVLDAVGAKPRTATDGPAVELGSQSALTLAMLVHELATNAMKYGALSVASGTNTLSWSIADDIFALDWREEGGPPVVLPTKRGFGSRLLAHGLGAGCKVDLRYDPAGFSAALRVPLATIS